MRKLSIIISLLFTLSNCDVVEEPEKIKKETRFSQSSSIYYDEAKGRLYLASPDDDQLVVVDELTLDPLLRINVAGLDTRPGLQSAPEKLTVLGDHLVVTQKGGFAQYSVSNISDVIAGAVPTASSVQFEIPCGDSGNINIVEENGSDFVILTCPFDDRLIVQQINSLNISSPPPVASLPIVYSMSSRPSGLVVREDSVYVSHESSGVISGYSLAELLSGAAYGDGAGQTKNPLAISPYDAIVNDSTQEKAPFEFAVEDPDKLRSVTQFSMLSVNKYGDIAGIFQSVDSRVSNISGGYGSVIDGNPRIEPRVVAKCGTHYAVFDGGNSVFSGPSAVAVAEDQPVIWVVNQYTQNVAALACTDANFDTDPKWMAGDQGDASLPQITQFRVGPGAKGIAVSASGLKAFVDVGFRHSVARLELTPEQLVQRNTLSEPSLAKFRTVPNNRFSPLAEEGRKLFFDGVNTHLTPSAVVTCGSCHPKGGDDGISWFLQTANIAGKLRRTPPGWTAKTDLLPLHWDGEFNDTAVLSKAATNELLEGDGLLVDFDAFTAYMEEIPLPTKRLTPQWELADVAAGEILFNARCSSCHSGSLLADSAPHYDVLGDVISGNTLTAERRLDQVDGSPSLVGVRMRAPYLHDGRAATLESVLTTHNSSDSHGVTSDLSANEIDQLVLFLESL